MSIYCIFVRQQTTLSWSELDLIHLLILIFLKVSLDEFKYIFVVLFLTSKTTKIYENDNFNLLCLHTTTIITTFPLHLKQEYQALSLFQQDDQ